MMEFFREQLILLRRTDNARALGNLPLVLSISSFIFIAAGVALDLLLPFNFIVNMIRGVVAIVGGVMLFSLLFILTSRVSVNRRRKDRYYATVRERFSFRQRANFSILVFSLGVIAVVIGDSESAVFTLKSLLLVSLSLTLLAFSRRLRSEFIKDIHEIPDIRDMAHQVRKRNKSKD